MEEVISIGDRYYIMVGSSLAERQSRVLKHGETFGVFDRQGFIRPWRIGDQGLYHCGTRHLSHLQMRIGGKKPLFLSSMVKEDNDLLVVDSANPDMGAKDGFIRGDSIHIFHSCFIWENTCYIRIRFENFSLETVDFPVTLDFAADFADIFEVRGKKREARGEMRPPSIGPAEAVIGYLGLDGIARASRLAFDPAPHSLDAERAGYSLGLEPHGRAECFLSVTCESDGRTSPPPGREEAFGLLGRAYREMKEESGGLESSNPSFNSWLNRSSVDLFMLMTGTPQGMYPYAGIPWFSTVFGRDGIITAMQMLALHPEVARGVLLFLAANQAGESMPGRDAEPGKILHETRGGEMANLGEIPFGRYYGSIDSTPLFLMLAGRYHARTGDIGLIRSIWPNLKAALAWMEMHGDRDGDGYLEYAPKALGGLSQQGWKDSEDSVFHADGAMAAHPIALCEVQGYAYAAKREAAALAALLGEGTLAERLRAESEALKAAFQRDFWIPELGTYALALDGSKRACRVRSSNAGHCLFTGIAAESHAADLVRGLLSADMYSGWGIRTLAAGEARYNPMSYHNGSVWPHDNALIALGMSRYGFGGEAGRVLEGLFQASRFVDLHRLPELFCGFARRPGEGPTLYPVACNPQAWASASIYMLLEACLGLSIDALAGQVRLDKPALPPFLDELRITGLRVGGGSVDLTLRRHGSEVTVEIPKRSGRVEVIESI